MLYYHYCPKCGYICGFSTEFGCPFCKIDYIQTDFEFKIDYSEEQYRQMIYEKYKVKENPLYNEESVRQREEKEREIKRKTERATNQKLSERNSAPLRCPKCNSTQVSIGQRGFTITTGFLGSNKTMNRCGNCGYKWYPKEK